MLGNLHPPEGWDRETPLAKPTRFELLTEQPWGLHQGPMYPYQLEGLNFLRQRCVPRVRVCGWFGPRCVFLRSASSEVCTRCCWSAANFLVNKFGFGAKLKKKLHVCFFFWR